MFVVRELLDNMQVNRNGTLHTLHPASGFWGSGSSIDSAIMCAANNIVEETNGLLDNYDNLQVIAQYMQQSGATLVIAWEVQEPDPIALYLQS